jgi:cell division protein FtsA
MDFFNIFRKSKKIVDRYAIALDIGTEFIKALIFRVEPRRGIVVGVGRARQGLKDMHGGGVTDINGVINNAKKALNEAAEMAGLLPQQVIIGIAGELVKGTTTTIRYLRTQPSSNITFEELKDIILRVQRRAFDRARTILAWETGQSEVDVRLVNTAIVDVRIDGYKVTNPLGFQGKEVQVGVFSAFAPIVHLGALQTIAENLDLDLLSITAEPYAVASCMGEAESPEFSAIFMDIGGGTTDVAVVKAGGVAGTKMFALGGRAFTRRIGTVLGINFPEAEELKLQYSRGELPSARAPEVRQALEPDIEIWFAGCELTLGELNVDLLPSRILLCGGASALPDLITHLRTARWSKKLPFARKPSIHFIKTSDVANIEDKTGMLTNPGDITPMALANVALELVGEETVMDSILSKAVGALRQ